MAHLDFEAPLVELEERIAALRELTENGAPEAEEIEAQIRTLEEHSRDDRAHRYSLARFEDAAYGPPGRHLAGGEEPWRRRLADLGLDADATHDVVHRGPDLHGSGRDVDVGQLLELVVHARQLALDVLGSAGHALADPGDVEVNAAMRAPPPLLDLTHDAARDGRLAPELPRRRNYRPW